jgi:hypothetical protein
MILLLCMGTGFISSLAAVERGSLTLQSEAGVEVVWESVLLGTTDALGRMSIGNIPPGTYSVELTSPGFADWSEVVDIVPGHRDLIAPMISKAELPAGEEPAAVVPESDVGEGLAPSLGMKSSTLVLLVLAAIVVVAAFLLADRRSRQRRADAKPEGPRIVVRGTSSQTKKLPTFYDDLKRRETDLENLVDVGSGRSSRQVIDVSVVDHGPVEDE